MRLNKTVTAVAVFVFLLSVCGCGAEASTGLLTSAALDVTESEEESSLSESVSEAEETGLCVYVCGAVLNPGVYYFPEDARVCDAITVSGGLTEDAATEYLNQAELLTDAERLYVPTVEEALALSGQGSEASTGLYAGITEEGLVNINYATEEELMTVSGIGQTRAAAIVEYRREHGLFASVDEIINVSGIGDSTFEKIKPYITVN